jgi:hypothetical protein
MVTNRDNPRNKIAESLRDFKAFAEGMSDRIHKDNKDKT